MWDRKEFRRRTSYLRLLSSSSPLSEHLRLLSFPSVNRPALTTALGPGVYRIGPSLDDAWGWAGTMREAMATRRLAAIGSDVDPRTLGIWVVGFCNYGRWVVGEPEDRPPAAGDDHGETWGRLGFLADTLHEAVVLRHAVEGAGVMGSPRVSGGSYLAIWEAGSTRRLSFRQYLSVLEREAIEGHEALRAALQS